MNSQIMKRAEEIAAIAKRRLDEEHIGCFYGMDEPLLLISTAYPGVWLEHFYDAVFYATFDESKLPLAENTARLFIKHQSAEGQLPCYILDERRLTEKRAPVGFTQVQECVSFARLCLLVYRMNRDSGFLREVYAASVSWVGWLKKYRMTTGRGLIEAFVGFDTGHDNSGRLEGLSCPGKYTIDGVPQNAAILPEGDEVAPMIAVDMNCNYYATLKALSDMARELSLLRESEAWSAEAREVKKRLIEVCFDPEDCFFYDVDKNGRKRKYLSSTVFHLFSEGVLDPEEDREIIHGLYERHISSPDEFATPYPYPSMAVCDPSTAFHKDFNCWGYYSQGLIALRATLWMEKYGFEAEFRRLTEAWVEAWCRHFDKVKLGQELDPITGVPTSSSEWYSSTMLFFIYSVEKLKK